jgi:hypothetical protein
VRVESSGGCYVALRGNGGSQELVLAADSGATSVSTTTSQDMNLRAGGDLILRAGGSTERARLDASGNLGIGASNPASRLHLGGEAAPVMTIQSTVSNSISGRIALLQADGRGADIYYDGEDEGAADALVFATRPNSGAAFDANERMVIEFNSGHVGINQRNPTTWLHVVNARCDGASWLTASSRELKSDIEPLAEAEARTVLEELEPVTFRYRSGDAHSRVGFIAEDVPELVADAERKGLSSMDILGVVTRVVQAQQEQIEALQRALAAAGIADPRTA